MAKYDLKKCEISIDGVCLQAGKIDVQHLENAIQTYLSGGSPPTSCPKLQIGQIWSLDALSDQVVRRLFPSSIRKLFGDLGVGADEAEFENGIRVSKYCLTNNGKLIGWWGSEKHGFRTTVMLGDVFDVFGVDLAEGGSASIQVTGILEYGMVRYAHSDGGEGTISAVYLDGRRKLSTSYPRIVGINSYAPWEVNRYVWEAKVATNHTMIPTPPVGDPKLAEQKAKEVLKERDEERKRSILAVLDADARREPEFASARKAAVIGTADRISRERKRDYMSVMDAEDILQSCRNYESIRGGGKRPSAEGETYLRMWEGFPEHDGLLAYERHRSAR